MDFATDSTNIMKRNGQVYPLVRAAGIGYSVGHKRSDDMEDGVCSAQIGNCEGIWSHLQKHNSYNGGQLSRTVDKEISNRMR